MKPNEILYDILPETDTSNVLKTLGIDEIGDAHLFTSLETPMKKDAFEMDDQMKIKMIEEHYQNMRMSDALMTTYKLVWDDFCSWYLEMIKPEFKDGIALPIDAHTFDRSIDFFEKILKLLHPFMPFITEELWHTIKERQEKDSIIVASWPLTQEYNFSTIEQFEIASEVITQVRNIRKSKNISPKEKIVLLLLGI